jgi:3-keto-L-gulonate-6-phosphate decarboxylase
MAASIRPRALAAARREQAFVAGSAIFGAADPAAAYTAIAEAVGAA